MKQTDRQIIQTDKAWNKLHSRLEQDGLLPVAAEQKQSTHRSFRYAGWAAAVLFLCISSVTVYLTNRPDNKDASLFTLQNSKNAAVLVKTLEDGSVVYLADNSQLEYPQHFQADKRTVSLKGNALFRVSGNKQRPFLIETEQMQIEVVGTAFHVKNNDRKPFELSVQQGTVKVTDKKKGESLFVHAGETVTLHARSLQLSKTKDEGQFALYTQQMQFKDERLADILEVVNQANPAISMQTTDAVKDYRLTVQFVNNSPDEIAQLLCAALHLTYTHENNTILISEH